MHRVRVAVKTQRHWTHPKSRYWVEFPPGPVAIGEETIRDFAERETRMGTLRLLAPTEGVMDRLAWYFHDADTQCLEQALQVATRHPVDLKRIARWARSERPHGEERYREFERRADEGSQVFERGALADPRLRAQSGLPARRGRLRSVK